ncbi:MAG: RNA-guided pseudouridylation complex pseudouridine synthase subunit Cbf5 [Methanomicrobiales archaeon]|nr:RNA-guided pseudouridylation complex pseudouridine synthase subunit Cbf5 [Methanomicrobiales archaeon]NYT21368.1 RNA-guided pseudouridylation complex pseudouridine synthase subunit Cbf5 [Methanomicrobiales archaeon]
MTGDIQNPLAMVRPGLLVIDKPRGPSSHQVTAWAGEILDVPVGHAGTLDPGVSGVLVVMLGSAVRLAPILLGQDKEYVCSLRTHGDVQPDRMRSVLGEFSGRVYQRPPRKSAVARNLRIRTVHEMDLLDFEGRSYLLKIRCDAGTYIRSLCHHVGLALGTGAHMEELRRTMSGSFGERDAVTLYQLKDAATGAAQGDPAALAGMIRSPLEALGGIPRVMVRDSAVDAVCHGAVLARAGLSGGDRFERGETVVMMTAQGELIGLGTSLVSSREAMTLTHGLVVAPSSVFMQPGTYPRGWKKAKEPARSASKR